MLLILLFIPLCWAQLSPYHTEWREIGDPNSPLHGMRYQLEIMMYVDSIGVRYPVVVHDWLVAPNIANNIMDAGRGRGYSGQLLPPARGMIAINNMFVNEWMTVPPLRRKQVYGREINVCPAGFCASLLTGSGRFAVERNLRYAPPVPPRCGTSDGPHMPQLSRRENVGWRPPAAMHAYVDMRFERMGLFASCDEYPFASTHVTDGTDHVRNIRVSCVPDREQKYQGALLLAFYGCLHGFHQRQPLDTQPGDPNLYYIAVKNVPLPYVNHYWGSNDMMPPFVSGDYTPGQIGFSQYAEFHHRNPNEVWGEENTNPECQWP